MTRRTCRYFVYANGHQGEEMTSKNDQPYSQQWESIRTTGMVDDGTDLRDYANYKCKRCGEPMSETRRP
jgi:hypothetical protein